MRGDAIRGYHCAMPRMKVNGHLGGKTPVVVEVNGPGELVAEVLEAQGVPVSRKRRSKKKASARKPERTSSDASGSDTNPVKDSDDDTKSSKA